MVQFLDKVQFLGPLLYKSHYNALANAKRRLIGQRHKFATVNPAIYCRKLGVIT